MDKAPLVSIVVPSYNQGKYLRETLDSILQQTYRPIEVLVFDGGSQDETVAVLQSYGAIPELNWSSAADDGVCDAVNKGLAKAAGEIIAIQSSDDVFLPGAIRSAVDAFSANPQAGIVFGDVEHIDEKSRVTGRDIQDSFAVHDYLGRFCYVPQPAAFFRHAVLEHVPGWRASVSYVADADFWFRVAMRYPVVKIDRVLGRIRYHAEQRDRQRARLARDWEASVSDLLANEAMTPRQRRYARMGIHLAWYRYSDDWRARTLRLYRAAMANPAALADPRFPRRELLPGREPIWALLSRAKRALRRLIDGDGPP
jgi:glycosyltransferase involved in cell wall biosynthesis